MPLAFQAPYLYFTLFACAILLISAMFFLRRLFGALEQLRRKLRPPAPFQPGLYKYNIHAALFWLFPVFAGVLLVAFAFYLSRYQYIGTRTEIAGTAVFQKGVVRYRSTQGAEVVSPVRGHMAAAAGIYVRFPGWASYIGLGTYHKIIAFRGFSDGKYHYTRPAADWLQTYADPLYLFAYRASGSSWSAIDVFYTESPYFSPGKHEIYATRSGYIVQ